MSFDEKLKASVGHEPTLGQCRSCNIQDQDQDKNLDQLSFGQRRIVHPVHEAFMSTVHEVYAAL